MRQDGRSSSTVLIGCSSALSSPGFSVAPIAAEMVVASSTVVPSNTWRTTNGTPACASSIRNSVCAVGNSTSDLSGMVDCSGFENSATLRRLEQNLHGMLRRLAARLLRRERCRRASDGGNLHRGCRNAGMDQLRAHRLGAALGQALILGLRGFSVRRRVVGAAHYHDMEIGLPLRGGGGLRDGGARGAAEFGAVTVEAKEIGLGNVEMRLALDLLVELAVAHARLVEAIARAVLRLPGHQV